jgi:glucan phosphoethanolaminetransferase (alkaline phosphatase superfamily)
MSVTSPATAEMSKDYILDQIYRSTNRLVEVSTGTIRDATYAIAVNVFVLLILLLVLMLIVLVMLDILTTEKAFTMFMFGFILLLVLVMSFMVFISYYTERQLRSVRRIYDNFISSERFLEIIDQTAATYNTNLI